MLKKQFLYLLALLTLQLFLSQSFAFLIASINHSSDTELSISSSGTIVDLIYEFNISTHANLWSVNKDESNKEESNLELISSIAYFEMYGLCYKENEIKNSIFLINNTLKSHHLPFYILNRVFRL